MLDDCMRPTQNARSLWMESRTRCAVILAAGFGMRMVPIHTEVSKGMLEIRGEKLIERLIRQLQEIGIRDITVVCGFMKEAYEYLIDAFGVKIAVSSDYAQTNNLYSLAKAFSRGKKENLYILPCDLWFEINPFREYELYSWYMMAPEQDAESVFRVNRKREIVRIRAEETGDRMIGVCYLTKEDADQLYEKVVRVTSAKEMKEDFWEELLTGTKKMTVPARVYREGRVIEINTYEQLRNEDSDSMHLHSDALETIAKALDTDVSRIREIEILKKGMTNRSFRFSVDGQRYIMRIPGEGTDQLINRQQEADVFRTIRGLGMCDDPVYINPENGYKITKFLPDVRVCDPFSREDLEKCMRKLVQFHEMRLKVSHPFDIFGQIAFYESLWEGNSSVYPDYEETKRNVYSLKPFVEKKAGEKCLTHIDAVPDNFLFYTDENGKEQLQLTDWEYAGMQDPHVDIAMFCIYSLYEKQEADDLIDLYFSCCGEGKCNAETRAKIYCYIAMCGLLWSNWCEYKRLFGVEFGEYSLRQYRYAKDFYRFAVQQMKETE